MIVVLAQVNPRWYCPLQYRAMFILNTNTSNHRFKWLNGEAGRWSTGDRDILSLEIYYEEVT